MFTRTFWVFAGERAIKTFFQTLVAVLGVGGIGLFEAPWLTAVSTAAMAAVVSVLTSLGSAPVGKVGDPSLVDPAPSPATSGGRATATA